MRKEIYTAALISGLLVATGAPAAAGAPVKTSSSSKYLESFSKECTPDGAGQTCTDISLYVSTDTGGRAVATLEVSTSWVDETGWLDITSSESGSTEHGVKLTLNRALDANFAPTSITLQDNLCSEDCGPGRQVIVSAAHTAGQTETNRHRGSHPEGACTRKYWSTATKAPTEGTVTIDGVTSSATGRVVASKVRDMTRCK
jgi:hypothetical protein